MKDEEIVALWRQHKEVMGFAHALLAALRERLAREEQEPVAWLVQYSNKHEFVWGQKPQWIADAIGIEPLYTTPQPRQWVGLTATEVHETEGYEEDRKLYRFARAIEAKLREKNDG